MPGLPEIDIEGEKGVGLVFIEGVAEDSRGQKGEEEGERSHGL